ncbi:unnamed protein product [Peronospora farinosa]|uniref:Crinkler effector protein N-terminal domain-containing protein n=1 Tax=Peronospora farinosa TaxID=134698 RepID=A0AAV0T6J5_9STRA|nr:unnamed protein product [Peronospora farinosa]
MVTLFCIIVGTKESVFPVDIDKRQSVGHLKDAIKAKRMYQFPADELQLYPAKMVEGKWLASSSDDVKQLKKGEKTHHVVELMKEDQKLQGEDYISDLLEGMEDPVGRQIHVLVVVPEEFTAVGNERKRQKVDEDACARAFDKLFEPEPRTDVGDDTSAIVRNFVNPPSCYESETEQTFIYLWDSLIATLLQRVIRGSYRRNTNASAATGLYRPDLCFYYGRSNVCVFRGEEKASGVLDVPIKELHEKLIWRYDDAPYIFGYAAVGLQVCLVAIRKDEMTERGAKAEIIETYDLGDLSSRLSFFLALLNLSTLFRPLVSLIQPMNVREYGIIRLGNGVQISFAENCVMKTYPFGYAK